MALNISPFTNLTPTQPQAVTVTTGTYTFSASALPYGAVRISNLGTAVAFVQFVAAGSTTTVGVTNAQPVLATASVILNSGGNPAIAYVSPGTTTIFITPGASGTGE